MTAKILPWPKPIDDALPNETLCICGVALGEHSHIGLHCPIMLGKIRVGFSAMLKFETEGRQLHGR